jgi:hypothetical protein
MQLNTGVQVYLRRIVLNKAEETPNLYARNNVFRGETAIHYESWGSHGDYYDVDEVVGFGAAWICRPIDVQILRAPKPKTSSAYY